MAILYAAPFLLIAAILFSVFAAIPTTRRFAIMAPTGAIAFGPASLIGYFLVVLVRSKLWGHNFAADRWDAIAYVMSGFLAATVAVLLVRLILRFLPAFIVQLIVFGGAFCSYFVLICSVSFGVRIYLRRNTVVQHSTALGIVLLCTFVLLSAVGAWFTSMHPNQFRSSRREVAVHY
jgi:hypothetical protein